MYRRGNSFRTENMNVLFPQENPRPISYHALLSLLAPPDANIIPWTPLSQQIFSMLPADALQQEQNVNTAIAVAETEKQESSNFFPRTTEPSPMPASPFPALANPIVMPESSPSPYFRDNGEHVEGLNSF